MTSAARYGLAALVLLAGPLDAQRRSAAYWLTLGAGLGSLGGTGAALYASWNLQRGANLFTLRGSGVVDVVSALVSGITGNPQNIEASEVGLLYGRARRPGHVFVAMSAGIGLAEVTRVSAGFSHRTYHPSIPVEAQLAWRAVPFFAVTAVGFASLNKGQSFTGFAAGVQLGGLY